MLQELPEGLQQGARQVLSKLSGGKEGKHEKHEKHDKKDKKQKD